MVLTLLAPELLLYLATNERISAGISLKKALKFYPRLVKLGKLAYNRIRGRAKSKEVSAQYQSTTV